MAKPSLLSRFWHLPDLIAKSVLIIGSAVSLSSCLDSHEEIWLKADGSGAARIQLAFPLAAAMLHGGEKGIEEMIRSFVSSTPALTSHVLTTSADGDRLNLDLTLTFDNALDLFNPAGGLNSSPLPAAATEFLGVTQINFSGLNLDFERRIELSKAIPGSLFIPHRQLQGHSITTIIHLPKAARTHNAGSSADEGRTLIWSTPLATALKGPAEMRFTMPLPIPWAIIGSLALMLGLLAASLTYYIRRRKTAA